MTCWKRFLNLILIVLFVLVIPSQAFSSETPEAFSFWPVEGKIITPFQLPANPYSSGGHRGIDIEAPLGAEVVAVGDGVVAFWHPNQGGNGMVISIDHPNGLTSTYLHLSEILPEAKRKGSYVKAGQPIGRVGNSGSPSSTIPHLHFGVFRTETRAESIYEYINPELVLPSLTVPSESSVESPASSPSEVATPLPTTNTPPSLPSTLEGEGAREGGSPNAPIDAPVGVPYGGVENSKPASSAREPVFETTLVAPKSQVEVQPTVIATEQIVQPSLESNIEPLPPKTLPHAEAVQPIPQEPVALPEIAPAAKPISAQVPTSETNALPPHSSKDFGGQSPLRAKPALKKPLIRSNYGKVTKHRKDSYIQQDRALPESKKRRLLHLIWVAFFGAIAVFLVRSNNSLLKKSSIAIGY